MKEAKKLLDRMDYRQHYKCVGEKGLRQDVAAKKWNSIGEQDIVKCGRKDASLKPEEIVVRKFKINHGLKDKYPLWYVKFYDKSEIQQTRKARSFKLGKKALEGMEPQQVQQWIVRCFVKSTEPAKVMEAEEAFSEYCKQVLGGEALSTVKATVMSQRNLSQLNSKSPVRDSPNTPFEASDNA